MISDSFSQSPSSFILPARLRLGRPKGAQGHLFLLHIHQGRGAKLHLFWQLWRLARGSWRRPASGATARVHVGRQPLYRFAVDQCLRRSLSAQQCHGQVSKGRHRESSLAQAPLNNIAATFAFAGLS